MSQAMGSWLRHLSSTHVSSKARSSMPPSQCHLPCPTNTKLYVTRQYPPSLAVLIQNGTCYWIYHEQYSVSAVELLPGAPQRPASSILAICR